MREIILRGKHSKNKFAIIDDEDYNRVSKLRWRINKVGYVRAGLYISLHRFILNLTDPLLQVDHINQDKLDNRKCNLRITNSLGNNRNRKKFNKITSSKFKGIRITKRKTYRVDISLHYKKIYCGEFATEIEAAEHYDYYALQKFGEFASLNFPTKNYSNFIPKVKIYKSNFIGVTWNKQRKKWTCQIKINNKSHNLGDCKNEIDSAQNYDFICWIFFQDKNQLNFPEIDYDNFKPNKISKRMQLLIETKGINVTV